MDAYCIKLFVSPSPCTMHRALCILKTVSICVLAARLAERYLLRPEHGRPVLRNPVSAVFLEQAQRKAIDVASLLTLRVCCLCGVVLQDQSRAAAAAVAHCRRRALLRLPRLRALRPRRLLLLVSIGLPAILSLGVPFVPIAVVWVG